MFLTLSVFYLHTFSASEMCIYTNDNFTIESLAVEKEKNEDEKEQVARREGYYLIWVKCETILISASCVRGQDYDVSMYATDERKLNEITTAVLHRQCFLPHIYEHHRNNLNDDTKLKINE